MTSRFLPFAFVELVSPYNKKNITRWLEDMNFMFSWQEQYLTRSLRSLVRYCSCHSNIKFISSRHRVISSMYYCYNCRSCLHPTELWIFVVKEIWTCEFDEHHYKTNQGCIHVLLRNKTVQSEEHFKLPCAHMEFG